MSNTALHVLGFLNGHLNNYDFAQKSVKLQHLIMSLGKCSIGSYIFQLKQTERASTFASLVQFNRQDK